jgi:hypothetical protein
MQDHPATRLKTLHLLSPSGVLSCRLFLRTEGNRCHYATREAFTTCSLATRMPKKKAEHTEGPPFGSSAIFALYSRKDPQLSASSLRRIWLYREVIILNQRLANSSIYRIRNFASSRLLTSGFRGQEFSTGKDTPGSYEAIFSATHLFQMSSYMLCYRT